MSVAALSSSSSLRCTRRPRSAAQIQSLQPAALTFRDHRLQAGKQVGDDRIKSSHSGTPFKFRNRNTEGLPRCWTGSPNPRLAS